MTEFADRAHTLDRFREYRAGRDVRVRNEIVVEHGWIAGHCVKRFTQRGEPRADLLQVAHLALVRAAERFEPADGNSFPQFAIPTVLGELRRHFRDATWMMSAPRAAKDLLPRVNSATEVLGQRLGRSPTVQEIADELSVGTDSVLQALEANQAYRPVSIDAPARTAQEDGPALAASMGDDDRELEQSDLRLTLLGAVGRLDERCRYVLLCRFYEGLTQREIGDRLGIGQVQVSRLIRAALSQVRESLELEARTSDREPASAIAG